MRNYFIWGLFLLSCFFISGCAHTGKNYYQYRIDHDFVEETWPKSMNTNPQLWLKGADRWFLTAQPNKIEQANRNAPYSASMTTLQVNAPKFAHVKVSGTFQVQLAGGARNNSVYVYGPNDEVRQVIVEIRNNTLFVYQAPGCKVDLCHVIVRINVCNLASLTQDGPGLVEGHNIHSQSLRLISNGSGKVLLAGDMRLARVLLTGAGDVTVLGANTPLLDIEVGGTGTLNLCGRVGVRSILHYGNGDLNIIGADTKELNIRAMGCGTISIWGCAGLRKVWASQYAKVYLYWVQSPALSVTLCENARVGLAGYVQNLNLVVGGYAVFEGQYLQADYAYVKTSGWAHANVNALRQIFASASDKSTIYYFGPPKILSETTTGTGLIIPVWNRHPMVLRPMPLKSRAR